MPNTFTTFAADRCVRLDTVDPDAGLDDLEPLVDVFRTARVVAIGENAHLVREFYRWRHRLSRFLVERCGYTVFTMESGFSEGLAVGAWVGGGPGELRELADHGITYTMGRCPEMRAHLAWLRESGSRVRFAGLDVPGSTASPLVALDHIGRYVATADPEAVPLVDRLTAAVRAYAGEHMLPAYRAYAALTPDERDRITALYAELAARLDLRTAGAGRADHRVVRHELRLAVRLDQAMRGYVAGTRDSLAARDLGMAETVFWLLEEYGPDVRVIVGAHNTHLRRTPVVTPAFSVDALGGHLAEKFGDEYLAVAVTAAGGTATTRRLDPDSPGGVRIGPAVLAPAVAGSVEAALPESSGPTVLDLRPARGRMSGPDRIRLGDGYLEAPVADAYDLVVNIPLISVAEQVRA